MQVVAAALSQLHAAQRHKNNSPAVTERHNFARDLLRDRLTTSGSISSTALAIGLEAGRNNERQAVIKKYRRYLHGASCAVSEVAGYCLDWLGARLRNAQDIGSVSGHLLVTSCRYDETPLPTRLADSMGMRKGAAKILQSEFVCGMVTSGGPAEPRHVTMTEFPTWLQAIGRNTAECIKGATNQVFAMPRLLQDRFPRKIRIVTTDGYGANFKCESSRIADDPSWTLLHISCETHAAHGCCGKMLDMVSGHCSALISGALSLGGHGQTGDFLRCMRSFIAAKLVILEEPPSRLADEYRQRMLDLFIPLPTGVTAQGYQSITRRRTIIGALANGDWRARGVLEHFESGCCRNRDHTVWKCTKYLVKALFGGSAHLLNRKNWVDSHKAFDQFGLAESCHGLLRSSYLAWTGSADIDEGRHPVGNFGAMVAIEDQGEIDEPASANPYHQYRDMDWAEKNKCAKRDFCTWIKKHSPLQALVITRLALEPYRLLMAALLAQAGEKWLQQQILKYIQAATREAECPVAREEIEYRILNAATNKQVSACLARFGRLMLDGALWRPVILAGIVTRNSSTLCFRMLARSGAALHELLFSTHTNYPFKLFQLLLPDSEAVANQILDDARACKHRLDPYSASFVDLYATAEGLGGEDARQELHLVAFMAAIDISCIEARHASIRRLCKSRSMQTHNIEFPDLSAEWFAARQRLLAKKRRWWQRPDATNTNADVGQESTDQPPDRRTGTRRRCRKKENVGNSGGSWRAFVHEHLRGESGAATSFRDLGVQYRALTNEQKNHYVELGRMAAYAAKAGAPAFGVGHREAARQQHRLSFEASAIPSDRSESVEAQTAALVPHHAGQTLEELLEVETTKRQACLKVEKARAREESKALTLYHEQHREAPHFPDHLQQVLHDDSVLMPWQTPTTILGSCSNMAELAFARAPHGLPKKMSEAWYRRHQTFVHSEQSPVAVVKEHRHCWRAGRCICKAPGLWLARCRKQVLLKCSARFSTKIAKQELVGGWIFLRLVGSSLAMDAVAPVETRTQWVHVALMYLSPYRPTLLKFEQIDPGPIVQQDPPEIASLRALREADARCQFRTLWELVEELDLNLQWDFVVYRVRTSSMPLAQIIPGEVIVERYGDESWSFWGGPDDKASRQGSGVKRPRGVARLCLYG